MAQTPTDLKLRDEHEDAIPVQSICIQGQSLIYVHLPNKILNKMLNR